MILIFGKIPENAIVLKVDFSNKEWSRRHDIFTVLRRQDEGAFLAALTDQTKSTLKEKTDGKGEVGSDELRSKVTEKLKKESSDPPSKGVSVPKKKVAIVSEPKTVTFNKSDPVSNLKKSSPSIAKPSLMSRPNSSSSLPPKAEKDLKRKRVDNKPVSKVNKRQTIHFVSISFC